MTGKIDQRRQVLRRSQFAVCCLSLALLFGVATGSNAFAAGDHGWGNDKGQSRGKDNGKHNHKDSGKHDKDKDKGKGKDKEPPLEIKELGGFSFGGKVDVDEAGESRHCDHGYADFLIPTNARKLPIVMWHSTHVKTWQSHPSFLGGHRAFDYIFASRGWGLYIIDPPRQGRANYGCFAPDFVSDWDQPGRDRLFINYRLGTWDIPGGNPTYHPGSQMAPVDKNGKVLNQIFRMRYPTNEHLPDWDTLQVEAATSLLQDIGPAILMVHSGSTRQGWLTRAATSKVAGIVALDPALYAWPTGELPTPVPGGLEQLEMPLADFKKLTQIPILVIVGDFLDKVANGPSRLEYGRAFVEKLNSMGGNAQLIHLPEVGQFGNSHLLMLEKNNDKIADLISVWLKQQRLDKR